MTRRGSSSVRGSSRWLDGSSRNGCLPGVAATKQKRAERVNAIFDRFDVVLTPGTVEAPLRVGALDGRRAFRTFYEAGRKIPHFALWNGVGNPAASIPAGFDRDGLPMSVQLVGPPDGEAVLLGIAHQIETAQPWTVRPPL